MGGCGRTVPRGRVSEREGNGRRKRRRGGEREEETAHASERSGCEPSGCGIGMDEHTDEETRSSDHPPRRVLYSAVRGLAGECGGNRPCV